MTGLKISRELTLPADVQTGTVIVYGGKGMGKTNLGSVVAEEMSRAGLRYSVLDPLGVWWGLQYASDGKSPGIECLILGGVHGDIPIEPTGGAVIADLVADEHVNVVIDISRRPNGKMWSQGEKIKFATDYCTRLFERQGEKREPLLQIIDEAARLAPQLMMRGDLEIALCLGAIERIGEEGRNVGLGLMLMTQRSARLNKSVSELADAMISFRIVGPRSIEAVMDWLGEHVPKSQINQTIEKLRKLSVGTALVVSPGWLEFEGIVKIRERTTFDSSKTPKPGERTRKPTGKAAKPDLAKYQERMQETIERAKQDDPKVLKAKIKELELAASKTFAAPQNDEALKKMEEALLGTRAERDEAVRKAKMLADMLKPIMDKWLESMKKAWEQLEPVLLQLGGLQVSVKPGTYTIGSSNQATVEKARTATGPPAPANKPEAAENGDSAPLGKAERAILAAVFQHRQKAPSLRFIAVRAGYAIKGGSFRNALGSLKTKGLLTGAREGPYQLTEQGERIVYHYVDDIPKGAALRESWLSSRDLGKCERMILGFLCDRYPDSQTVEQVAIATDYEVNGGSFRNSLGKLRTLTLIEGKNPVKASDDLF